jgi:hypothetical protein
VLREFFKSYVHTRVHYVRVDSDSQYPKVKLLLTSRARHFLRDTLG